MAAKTNHSTAVPGADVQVPSPALWAALAPPLGGTQLSTPALVRAAVRLRGTSLAQLSLQHGYHRDAFGQALRSRRWRSRRIERLLATFLGVRPADLWPDRYPDATQRGARRHEVRR